MDLIPLEEFTKIDIKLRVTPNQQEYIKAIRRNAITFVCGQAGCGKTFLAVAEAIRSLQSVARPDRRIERVLLLRPAVTAGESVGYLPGTLEEKTSYYMRPFHTSGCKLVGEGHWNKMVKSGVIDFETMSFIRGETWDRTFVLIDEAQNCTPKQMEMLLTRLGKHSKIVVAGDDNQSDLEDYNGLSDALTRLEDVQGVAVCHLTGEDNMRHPIVKAIAERYSSKVSSLPPVTYWIPHE